MEGTKILRFGLPLGIFLVAALAMSHPTFTKDVRTIYKLKKDSKLYKANCGFCHVGMSKKLNPYGLDVEKEMKAQKSTKITAEVLKKIEKLDSDKDGVPNKTEIEKDTLPGDPKSK